MIDGTRHAPLRLTADHGIGHTLETDRAQSSAVGDRRGWRLAGCPPALGVVAPTMKIPRPSKKARPLREIGAALTILGILYLLTLLLTQFCSNEPQQAWTPYASVM
jgi:hypothetical protein